jgi:transposase InsO family protein
MSSNTLVCWPSYIKTDFRTALGRPFRAPCWTNASTFVRPAPCTASSKTRENPASATINLFIRLTKDQSGHRPQPTLDLGITKLRGPAKWTYFYFYAPLDVFSRYVVGWMVAHWEGAELARQFIEETIGKHQVPAGQLTLRGFGAARWTFDRRARVASWRHVGDSGSLRPYSYRSKA